MSLLIDHGDVVISDNSISFSIIYIGEGNPSKCTVHWSNKPITDVSITDYKEFDFDRISDNVYNIESCLFTGLSPNTTYYFVAYPSGILPTESTMDIASFTTFPESAFYSARIFDGTSWEKYTPMIYRSGGWVEYHPIIVD